MININYLKSLLNVDLNRDEYNRLDKNLENELLIKYKETNNISIRNELVKRSMNLVLYVISNEFDKTIYNNDDKKEIINRLFSYGCLGLIIGIDSIDKDKIKIGMTTYLYKSIKSKIIYYLRYDESYFSGLAHLTLNYSRIISLRNKYNYEITDEEIKKELNMTDFIFNNCLRYCSYKDAKRIYLDDDNSPSTKIVLNELRYDIEDEIDKMSLLEIFNRIFNDDRIFPNNESGVRRLEFIRLRFFEEKTFLEIGKIYNLTKEGVRVNINIILKKIKKYYYDELINFLY